MTTRIPVAFAVALSLGAPALLVPSSAEAQGRRAVARRSVIVARPAVVVRPRTTVFLGGYYYPSLYRASLYYGGPGYVGYFGPRYYGAGYYQWPYYGAAYDLSGSVRLQVTPRETEVFIDGYFAGTVDDFDGVFQRLHVEPGEHELQLYLPGHRLYQQRVYLQPGRTFRIRHVMQPLGPGEAEAARPAGAPLPAAGAGPRGPYPGAQAPPGADPRPAAGAGASGFGQLSVRVQPSDAEILIDGEKWVGTLSDERLVVELSAGTHRLEIRREGYRSYFTDVNVREGETRILNVAMTKQ